jgi:hypothetical protein
LRKCDSEGDYRRIICYFFADILSNYKSKSENGNNVSNFWSPRLRNNLLFAFDVRIGSA